MKLLDVAVYLGGHFAGQVKVAWPEVRGELVPLEPGAEVMVVVVGPEKGAPAHVARGSLTEMRRTP